MRCNLFYFLTIFLGSVTFVNAGERPFADAHIHFNWDQAEIISADEVAERMRRQKVGLTLVAGTPSHLALELREVAGDWVVPIFSPYIHEQGKRDWFLNERVIQQAKQGLSEGLYFGVGEIHFMSGFQPGPDNKIFLQLMALAKQYRVPAMIHVDAADERYFLSICQAHPEVKIIYAHAGGNLSAHHIRVVLEQCPHVWVDFAARDDWRYGGLTNERGHLRPEWRKLVLEFPQRFITGTDPVWRVTRTQSWDESDEGWDHYQQLYDYHQAWLNDLPENVRQKIAWDNVRDVLGVDH